VGIADRRKVINPTETLPVGSLIPQLKHFGALFTQLMKF